MILMYGIGELAAAINLAVVSVRLWLKERTLPPPTLTDEQGRRWFSLDYIGAMAKVRKEGKHFYKKEMMTAFWKAYRRLAEARH